MTEIYFVQHIDNSHVVKVVDPRLRRDQMVLVGALTVLFALVLGYCWQNYQAVHYGYGVEALLQQRDSLLEWNRALALEEAAYKDPGRIYDIAQQKLGMRTAGPAQVLRLDEPASTDAVPELAAVRPASRALMVAR